jgi:hypothetical protein
LGHMAHGCCMLLGVGLGGCAGPWGVGHGMGTAKGNRQDGMGVGMGSMAGPWALGPDTGLMGGPVVALHRPRSSPGADSIVFLFSF